MVPIPASITAENAVSQPSSRAQGTPRKLTARPGRKDTLALPQRHPSQKMTAREQRSHSPWQTPVVPSIPPAEHFVRDSRNESVQDDVFFRAYYDPSFQRILLDWNDDLSTKHQRTAVSQEENIPPAATFGTRDGKVFKHRRLLCGPLADAFTAADPRDLF